MATPKVAGRKKQTKSNGVSLQASRVKKVAGLVQQYGLSQEEVARILYVIEAERVRLAAITNVVELTGAIVKGLYEGNANTNAFTDALLTKLNGIEANAKDDQTGAEVIALIDAILGVSWKTDTDTQLTNQQVVDAVDAVLGNEDWKTPGTGATDLTYSDGTIESSTGTDAEIPDATSALKGLATAAQITKLDSIEAGATGDQTPQEIVDAVNANLGNSDWQTPGQNNGASGLTELAGLDADGNPNGSSSGVTSVYVKGGKVTDQGGGDAELDIRTRVKTASTKASIIAAADDNVVYTEPGSLGAPAVLTIPDWGSFQSITILADSGQDYDSQTNDFVLQIVDQSGQSNSWDPSDTNSAFDLVVPGSIRAWDGGGSTLGSQELAVYGVSEAAQDNSPSPAITWSNGTLNIRIGGADFKAKARNSITITA